MENDKFKNRTKVFIAIANARKDVVAFLVKQGMNDQLYWFIDNGYLKKHDQKKDVIAYEIIKEPRFYVYEEHHDLAGNVSQIVPIGIIELTRKQMAEVYQEVYVDNNLSVIQEWLESFKYFGYQEIEVRDNLYIDCVDSDFKFRRPHIIFSYNEVK